MRNYIVSLLFAFLMIFTFAVDAQTPNFLSTGNSSDQSGKTVTSEDYTKAVNKAQEQQLQQQMNSTEIPSPNSAIMTGPAARSNAPGTTSSTEKKPEKSIYQQPEQAQTQQQQEEQPQPITPLNQTLPFATGTTGPAANPLPPPGAPPSPTQTQPKSGYYSGFGGTSGTGTTGGTTGGSGSSGGWGGGIYH